MSEYMKDPQLSQRARQSIAEGEQAMASGASMVTLDDVVGRRLTVNVSLGVGAAMEDLAARRGISITEIVALAVSAYKAIDDEQTMGGRFYVERGDTIREITFA